MHITDSNEVQWHGGPGHREGGIRIKDLLIGEPGANNYWLALARVDEHYDAPPHKHNFEQVRFMLEGAFDFGGQAQEAGTIGYFCEGTTYTQTARGPSLTLLLQCEGPSRSRYMGVQELYASVQKLRDAGGKFEQGKHLSADGTVQDGYEAAWEELTSEPVRYATPRFQQPVIMATDAFDWQETNQPGVQAKHLGAFSERKLELRFLRLEPDAATSLEAATAPLLLYVLSGAGTLKEAAIQKACAIRLDPSEKATLKAGPEGLELFAIRLPE